MLILFIGFAAYGEGNQEEEPAQMTIDDAPDSQWNLKASNGLLIGGYGDNFVYDGKAELPISSICTGIQARKPRSCPKSRPILHHGVRWMCL